MGRLKSMFLTMTIIVTTKATATSICPESCICDNRQMKCNGEIPTLIPDRITDVELLDIEVDMYVDGVFCKTSWNNVRNLSLVCLNKCQHRTIMDNDAFRCLGNLERLKLTLDELNGFTNGTFLGLNNVTTLDLTGCTILCSSELIVALSDNTVLPLLKELILKSFGNVGCDIEIEVDQTLVDILGKRPIQILDFSYSNVIFVKYPNLNPICDTLTTIDLSYSTIGSRSKVDGSKVCKSLQVVNFNGAHFPGIEILPSTYNFTNQAMSIDLERLYLSVNNIYANGLLSKDYSFLCQNCSLLFTRNNITNLEFCGYSLINSDVEILFVENHLRRLALTNDSMGNIGLTVFQNLTLLNEIDLSYNRLSQSSNFDGTFHQLFRRNVLLEKLYLANNGFTYLPFDTFRSNRLLSLLDLSGNEFEQITFDVHYLLYLKVLDMRNNAIVAFNSGSRDALDELYSKQQTTKVNKTFEVDLRGNHFSCDCYSLDFVEWFVTAPYFTNKDQYTCQVNGQSFPMTELSIRAAKEDCERPIRRRRTIILSFVVPSVTILCVIGAIFGFVKQRRRLLRSKRFADRVRLLQGDCVDFRFLVFLSFSSEDDEFVLQHVLTPMKVYIYHPSAGTLFKITYSFINRFHIFVYQQV